MINIDVTLRDGGYRNGFAFPLEYAKKHARLSRSAGFDWIEVGYLNGSVNRASSRGLTGISAPEYIYEISQIVGPSHTSLIAHHKNVSLDQLKASFDAGARLIRICVTPDNLDDSMQTLIHAKQLGFKVCLNLTRASRLPLESILAAGRVAEAAGVEAFFLADSNGSMTHTKVGAVYGALHSELPRLPLGLHAHNHRGYAMTNALAAAQFGATWMDSAFQGMGKGAGNLIAEQWLATEAARDVPLEARQFEALVSLSQAIRTYVPEAAPEIHPFDLLTGFYDLGFEVSATLQKEPSRAVSIAREMAIQTGTINE